MSKAIHGFAGTPLVWSNLSAGFGLYLQVSAGGDNGNTFHQPVVAATRAPLHLHAGRP